METMVGFDNALMHELTVAHSQLVNIQLKQQRINPSGRPLLAIVQDVQSNF